MAKQMYKQTDIELQDGTEVTIKPLPIARLRRFMECWAEIANVKEGDDGFDVFVNCSGIALEQNFSQKFDTLSATAEKKKKGEFLSVEYREYLEETLDLDTIYQILDVAGGIKLNDPKLMEAALAAAEEE